MLTDLLRALNSGGIHGTEEIARRLGVSEALIAAAVDDLARRGYLEPVSLRGDGNCDSGACAGCALVNTCSVAGAPQPRTFILTGKGQRAAETQGN